MCPCAPPRNADAHGVAPAPAIIVGERFDKACWCLVHAGVQLGANNMSAFTVSLLSVTSFRWRTGGGAHRSIHHGPMIGFTVAAAAASIKAAVRRPSKKKSTGKDAIKGARSRMRGTHCSESWR